MTSLYEGPKHKVKTMINLPLALFSTLKSMGNEIFNLESDSSEEGGIIILPPALTSGLS